MLGFRTQLQKSQQHLVALALSIYHGVPWVNYKSLNVTVPQTGNLIAHDPVRIAGDAAATDPSCELSPLHGRMRAMAEQEAASSVTDYAYRGRPTPIPVH